LLTLLSRVSLLPAFCPRAQKKTNKIILIKRINIKPILIKKQMQAESAVINFQRAVSSVEALSFEESSISESLESLDLNVNRPETLSSRSIPESLESLDLDVNRPETCSERPSLTVGTCFKGTILIPGMTGNKEEPERPQEYVLEILRQEEDELGCKVRSFV
jgi:hypothetical protein